MGVLENLLGVLGRFIGCFGAFYWWFWGVLLGVLGRFIGGFGDFNGGYGVLKAVGSCWKLLGFRKIY